MFTNKKLELEKNIKNPKWLLSTLFDNKENRIVAVFKNI
jgi:hypothetical protein